MIVDIGGGTTDIAVISLAGIVYSKSVRVAGNAMDEAITQYVKQGARPAHRRADGRAHQDRDRFGVRRSPKRKEMEVKGRHVLEGKPTTITLNDDEIREALAEPDPA